MTDSLNEETLAALHETTDMLRRRNGGLIESHGISTQQYQVLRILRKAGLEGLPTLGVGAQMIEQSPGVTRLLDKLELRGMIRRERQYHDRRLVLCFITQQGLNVLAGLDAPLAENYRQELACLNEEELTTLLDLLGRVKTQLGTLNK